MRVKRAECEICNCVNFEPFSDSINYKCKCSHGDVWHIANYEEDEKNIDLSQKLRLLFKPLKKLLTKRRAPKYLMRECPICIGVLTDLSVLSCGHGFCTNCTNHIKEHCPICRSPITDKIKVYI